MKPGRIVFLCGYTSTGKTSIVDAIQDGARDLWYVVANDLMVQMVPERYLREDYWAYESRTIAHMYRMARLLSDAGENVLIDGCLIESPELPHHYALVREVFRDAPFWLVEVTCPLEVCRLRNLSRADRHEYQSHEQSRMWARDVAYDLTVDTSERTPEACARIILRHVGAAMREG